MMVAEGLSVGFGQDFIAKFSHCTLLRESQCERQDVEVTVTLLVLIDGNDLVFEGQSHIT